jgi:hypothetical protein
MEKKSTMEGEEVLQPNPKKSSGQQQKWYRSLMLSIHNDNHNRRSSILKGEIFMPPSQ